MALSDIRGVLFAISLGILPIAAGCVSHDPLPSDIARAPVAWSGPPIALRVGILGIDASVSEELAPIVAVIARQTVLQVMKASKVVTEVRLVDVPEGAEGPPAAAVRDLDVLVRGDVLAFELYSTYLWWLLYGAMFAIPVGSTLIVILIILAGGPVASDHAILDLVLHATDARTGKPLGAYRGGYEGDQRHSIYQSVSVNESFISHPEIVFQAAAGAAIQAMARDRFWLLRNKR